MKVQVGIFNEDELKNGFDKIAVKKAKEKTGYKYTETKMVKVNGKPHLKIFLISNESYYNSLNV